MSARPHPTSGYLISEDEQFTLIKVAKVMALFEDLLMTRDRRDGEVSIDPAALQSLFCVLRTVLEPVLASTRDEPDRYVSSLEPVPIAHLTEAIRAAAGLVDPARADDVIRALQAVPSYRPVAETLRSVAFRSCRPAG